MEIKTKFKTNMSEDDFKVFKQWLTEMLDFNVITVTFLKKDGTERVMKCTTSKKIVPAEPVVEHAEPKKEKQKNDDVKPVYDIEASAWRSFRWDAVKRIEFNISGTDET